MKEKTRTKTTKIYQCSYCSVESRYKGDIKNHEFRKHTCKHEKVYYEFSEASEDAWWFETDGIKMICRDCEEQIEEINFEQVDDRQDILKKIYKVIKDTVGIKT
jgi:hypothetical protein